MKLINITFGSIPRLPGLRPTDLGKIDCDKPGEALKGWRLFLRGASAFFVSPPGWVADQSEKRRDPKGPRTVYEMPRTEVLLHWHASEDELENVFKNNKWESPPFGWQPTPIVTDKPLLEQVPASQVGDA
jgi:hypothetical protein